MTPVSVSVMRLVHGQDLPLPTYATADSAGMDLLSAEAGPVTIEPGARTMIATGIAIQLPSGFEAQVRPRSGLAAKHCGRHAATLAILRASFGCLGALLLPRFVNTCLEGGGGFGFRE